MQILGHRVALPLEGLCYGILRRLCLWACGAFVAPVADRRRFWKVAQTCETWMDEVGCFIIRLQCVETSFVYGLWSAFL